jgi:hypothetical protein
MGRMRRQGESKRRRVCARPPCLPPFLFSIFLFVFSFHMFASFVFNFIQVNSLHCALPGFISFFLHSMVFHHPKGGDAE